MNELALQTQSTSLSFGDDAAFAHIQRVAKMFSESQLVPTAFQKNLPNVVVALEMSQRIGASPLMVMQNLNIIHGKPSFGSSFMIATVNACGKFSPLRFAQVGERDTDDWGCYATAKSKVDAAECRGVTVTLGIAKAEGWVSKNGSKWKTMPELMLQYRAATWWVRMFAPELLMGFPTVDEAEDIKNVTSTATEVEPMPQQEKKRKGIVAMRAQTVEVPVEAASDAGVSPAEDTAAPAAQELMRPVTQAELLPKTEEPAAAADAAMLPRCEIVGIEEKMAKKAGGIGPVCTVRLKGDYEGIAYYDGAAAAIPSIGAIVDVVLVDSVLKGTPVKVLKSATVVA